MSYPGKEQNPVRFSLGENAEMQLQDGMQFLLCMRNSEHKGLRSESVNEQCNWSNSEKDCSALSLVTHFEQKGDVGSEWFYGK